MVSFSSKTIENPLSLGERLRQSREGKNITVAQVSKAINISSKYLEAIEAGNYRELPGEVYAKNFLKAYTKFLQLNTEDFLKQFNSESIIYSKTKGKSDNDFKKPVEKISKTHLLVTPKILKGLLIGFLALVVLLYLGVKVRAIITPPVLAIITPSENLVTTQNFIEVSGSAEVGVVLEINGQQVLPDTDGNFTETIDLQRGTNVIEVKAIKRHGKETKVYRQVVVVDEESNIAENSN